MGLANLENGLYLDEWCKKFNDYDLQNSTIVAVYDCGGEFIAKFQFADLARCVNSLAFNRGLKVPFTIVRDADPKRDGSLYPQYEDSIKGGLTASTPAIGQIQKPLTEAKFVKVVELAECDEAIIKYIKNDVNAMDKSEVLPGSGVYRRIG